MCAMLSIFIDPAPGSSGELKGMRATADVLPVSGASTRIPPVLGLVVLLDEPDEPAIAELSPGEWLVRAKLPSGELLHETVSMGGAPREVRLRSKSAAPSGLGFEFATGLLPVTASQLTSLLSQTAQIQQRLTVATSRILEGLGSVDVEHSGGASSGNLSSLPSFGWSPASVPRAAPRKSVGVEHSGRASSGSLSSLPSFGRSPASVPRAATRKSVGVEHSGRASSGSFSSLPSFGRSPVSVPSLAPRKLADIADLVRIQARVALPKLEELPVRPTEAVHLSTVVSELSPHVLLTAWEADTPPSARDMAAMLFGHRLDEQQVTLEGDGPLKYALIDLSAEAEALANPADRADGKVRRAFAWLRSTSGDKVSIACMPRAWLVLGSYRQADMRILVASPSDDQRAFQLTLAVHDPNVASVLGFLQKGELDSAERLAKVCIAMLDAKKLNPYAAAAAAYVLVHGNAQTSADWQQWVRNLCNWFPGIPDGPILLATLSLQRGAPGQGAEGQRTLFTQNKILILRAIACGPPMFRMGIKLLTENIDILCSLGTELGEPTQDLARAAQLVRWMRLRVDTSQPFAVFRI